jgi:probable phosphoglycerate mutase
LTIYAIRHGQTNWNLEGRIQGKTDSLLNEEGKSQAAAVAKTIPKDIDFIISSPMARALKTAEIINEEFGVDIILDERIVERSFGDYEGLLTSEIDLKPLRDWSANLPVPNGETAREVAERTFEFLDDVIKKYSGKTLLIVTHGQILRAFHWYFDGLPKDGKEIKLELNNCALHEFKR